MTFKVKVFPRLNAPNDAKICGNILATRTQKQKCLSDIHFASKVDQHQFKSAQRHLVLNSENFWAPSDNKGTLQWLMTDQSNYNSS